MESEVKDTCTSSAPEWPKNVSIITVVTSSHLSHYDMCDVQAHTSNKPK